MEILLNTNYRYWFQSCNCYSIGFIFVKDKLLQGEQLITYLYQQIKQNSLCDALNNLNGSFAAILNYQQQYYLIVDSIRSYPLLYGFKGERYFIADSAEKLSSFFTGESFDKLAAAEFLSLGYLSGGRSLYNNIKHVEAGSYVIISEADSKVIVYHKNIYPKFVDENDKQLILKSKALVEQGFKRILKTCGDRQLVLPLSGGYDSRLLACLCKKFALKNVICYTYGKRNSFEVEISRKVAEILGYEWYFVEYTEQVWSEICDSEYYKEYEIFAGNLNAVPIIQEFPAIYVLKKKNIIAEDAIVIPGHSGDFLGGSHLPIQPNVAPLNHFIYQKYFRLNRLKTQYANLILNNLKSSVGTKDYYSDMENYLNVFNDWGIKVRQANFIVNSVRLYEYFKLDWRLPLWDNEFVRFWNSIDWGKKYNSTLYHHFLFECYFKCFYVDFKKEEQVYAGAYLYIRHLISVFCHKHFPSLIRKISKKNKNSDINLFSVVSDFFYKKNELPEEIIEEQSKEVNAPLAIEYMNIIKNMDK